MTAFVRHLANNSKLGLISNTNVWHFQWVAQKFPIVSSFPIRILSYEIFRMKPDPEVFSVARRHVEPAQRAVFIDDLEENVFASRAVGFEGVHFRGLEELRAVLHSLGVTD